MKVLLVKPYNLGDHIQPPLGLGYLASACRKNHDVTLLDCIKDRVKTEDALVDIIKRDKPDVVGIQCYTFHTRYIKEIFHRVKRFNKDITCIIGGPHPSTVPLETMEWFSDELDYAFKGEAEIGLPMFLEQLSGSSPDLSAVPGLIWRENGVVRMNAAQNVDNLDELGYPAWDLITPQTYPEAQHGAFFKKFPIAPVIVTRGCPYQCTFCAANKIAGTKIRKHSIGYILNQMQLLYKDFGIREFHIIDDNFTFDMDYAKELLRGIIGLGLDISWATPNGVRLDRLDKELLQLMKQSGLYLISLGIESGSDRVLQLMKKSSSVSKIREAVKMIRYEGIDIAGFFILGFPGETREEIERTMRFSRELDLIRANFFTYLPFPGTESFNELKAKGDLDNVDWDNFYFMSASYVPKGITREELKGYQKEAFTKFFLRPRILWKNIMQVQSFRHFKFLFARFYKWILKG